MSKDGVSIHSATQPVPTSSPITQFLWYCLKFNPFKDAYDNVQKIKANDKKAAHVIRLTSTLAGMVGGPASLLIPAVREATSALVISAVGAGPGLAVGLALSGILTVWAGGASGQTLSKLFLGLVNRCKNGGISNTALLFDKEKLLAELRAHQSEYGLTTEQVNDLAPLAEQLRQAMLQYGKGTAGRKEQKEILLAVNKGNMEEANVLLHRKQATVEADKHQLEQLLSSPSAASVDTVDAPFLTSITKTPQYQALQRRGLHSYQDPTDLQLHLTNESKKIEDWRSRLPRPGLSIATSSV